MGRFEQNFTFNSSDNESIIFSSAGSTLQDGRFEKSGVFRNNFNKFHLTTLKFTGSKNKQFPFGGVPIGKYNAEQILVDNSDSHTLIMGATGSKKSRLVIMPSVYILGAAGESMIISDPKAEIYTRTAEFLRGKGYNLAVINLRNPNTCHAWNPLSIPYVFYKRGDIDRAYEFANDVAFNLTQAEKDLSDPFWDNSAGDLFFGLAMLLFKYVFNNKLADEYANLYNLIRLRRYLFKDTDSTEVKDEYLRELIDSDEIIAGTLSGTITAPDKTKTSILSTFDEKMRCFIMQPSLLEMLSNNTVDLHNSCKKKFAIFLIMPDEKTTYHKLVSLFVKQSYEYLIYEAQKSSNGRLFIRVNFILDEFSSLPTIKDFPNMVSAARSRDIRFVLVVQSKHQLVERYQEEAETIRSNCANWIFLTSRELPLLADISALCGKNKSGRDIVSVSSLQHLSKEKGQALVLSGRLLPYISELIDISEYDHDRYVPLKMNIEKRKQYLLNNFDCIGSKQNKKNVSDENRTKIDMLDFKIELERKFDELFGEVSEED